MTRIKRKLTAYKHDGVSFLNQLILGAIAHQVYMFGFIFKPIDIRSNSSSSIYVS